MLPLKSSSRFQLDLGSAEFLEEAGAEVFGVPPANLDVPIDMPRGFLGAVMRGVPWLGAKGREEVATDCTRCIMI